MSKPRNQRPINLEINYLPKEGLWQAFDFDGIEYRMTLSLMDDLKRRFKDLHDVAEWYKTLFPGEKKYVQRIGVSDEDLNYYDGEAVE